MDACPLLQHEAWLCYITVYCTSITYSLSTSLLTAKQIDSLHTVVTLQILPRMGYQRYFLKAVVYESKYAGGIGFLSKSNRRNEAHQSPN
eukprot:8312728-Ditylum_brightwellii.AAC.1